MISGVTGSGRLVLAASDSKTVKPRCGRGVFGSTVTRKRS